MRPTPLVAVALAVLSTAAGLVTRAAPASLDVAEATLDNGLRVLVLEDHRSPVISVQVWYRVGSRNERPGATGLAHFLEHMMFKGTPTHGKGEFARMVEQNGGQDNAFTTQDVTSYFVDIAADKVDMVLGLESERVRRLFGQIPRGPELPPVTAVEPPQIDERRVLVSKAGAQLPIVDLAWHVPNHESPDSATLELLSTILSEGRASRLYRKLVYEGRLALGAGGDYSYFSRDPNRFAFYATPLPGQSAQALERALLAEVELLKSEPVPEEELQRAKNQIEAAFVWRQDSVHSRASSLARFELAGSWRLQADFVSRIRAVTAADLQRVARTHFPTDRKNVAILLPAEETKPATK